MFLSALCIKARRLAFSLASDSAHQDQKVKHLRGYSEPFD